MAITASVPSGASSYSTTAADSYATSSWSGNGATATYVAFTMFTGASLRDGSISGNSLTWTQIGSPTNFDSIASPARRCQMFRASGIPATGATTIDGGAGTDFAGGIIVVAELLGTDTSTTDGVRTANIVQTPSDSSASPHSVTLAAFADSGNATLACFFEDDGTDPTVEGGGAWSSLSSGNFASPSSSALVEFNAGNDTSPSCGGNTVNWCGFAVEILKAPVGGTGTTMSIITGF